MGFTTKGKTTHTRYYDIRIDVDSKVDDVMEKTGWDRSDVINRAVLYYYRKYKNDELRDSAPSTRTSGFTTSGIDTQDRTVVITDKVRKIIDNKSDEWQWYKKDVVNRALMYYVNEIQNGEIDDNVYVSASNA